MLEKASKDSEYRGQEKNLYSVGSLRGKHQGKSKCVRGLLEETPVQGKHRGA